MKVWIVLYLVGLPMVFLGLYFLHDAIWPGEGIFVNLGGNSMQRATVGRVRGDFSGLFSLRYLFFYYLPIGLGLGMCAYGTRLRMAERVERHDLFDD